MRLAFFGDVVGRSGRTGLADHLPSLRRRLGLAYAGQEVDRLPAETHDQPLDAVLTETGFRAFRPNREV